MPFDRLSTPAAIALVVLVAETCHAELFVERIMPPCFQRGATTRVTLVGTEVDQATALWSTLPDEILKAKFAGTDKPGRATFDVTVADDAQPGLYGLRVATLSGLSNPHLFAIEDLPIVFEEESLTATDDPNRPDTNGRAVIAQAIELPASIAGTSFESDIDCFAIEVAAGQKLSFEVVGSRLGKGFDPLVTIFDPDDKRVVSHDNSIGLFFDGRFEHTFARAGRHVIQLRDTRYHGSVHWAYMLRIGRFPAARVAIPSTVQPGREVSLRFPEIEDRTQLFNVPQQLTQRVGHENGSALGRFFFGVRNEADDGSAWLPLSVSDLSNEIEVEPNDRKEAARSISVPCNIHGLIDEVGDEDWFQFDLKQGARLSFVAETREMGSPADLEVTLFDPSGKELRRKDDESFDDARFTHTVARGGVHRLHVHEIVRKGGPAYAYRIEISRQVPKLEVTSDAGRLAIPKGTWQPLHLNLIRSDYSGPVEVRLVGAPDGMRLERTEFPPGERSLSAMLHVAPETREGVYTLQVFAQGADSESARGPQTVARTFPLIDRLPTGRGPHGEPFELRENQQRLPPSLTDRIAVVVLPQAPYEFDIEPKLVTLPRYVETSFDIKTTFRDAIDGEVSFVARGGTLEPNRLQKPTTKSQIPNASVERSVVTTRLTSGVNTPIKKHRVTVTGTAKYRGRSVFLTRVFELQTKVAFAPKVEPQKIELTPGATTKLRISANRLAPYDGAFTIKLKVPNGLQIEESVEFGTGTSEAELELRIPADTKPGKYSITLSASARIDKFSEQADGGKVVVTVKAKDADQ